MDPFFDAKFYQDAMSAVFSCQLPRAGSDRSTLSKKRLGAARSCASNVSLVNQGKGCCQRFRKCIDPATERLVNAAALHCAAQPSYVPKPLPGWTSDEQLALIAAVKAVPSEHSLRIEHCGWTEQVARHKYLLLISEHVPSKGTQECERCLQYLQLKRVAYFGQHHLHDHRG